MHCACEDYCRGACFACGCAACAAATWSFPGGGAHCTKADCSMDDLAAECGDFVRRNGMSWSLSGDATDLNGSRDEESPLR